MDWINIAVDIILSITVFTWGYHMGRDKGYLDGFKNGANVIGDIWKEWINEMEEE